MPRKRDSLQGEGGGQARNQGGHAGDRDPAASMGWSHTRAGHTRGRLGGMATGSGWRLGTICRRVQKIPKSRVQPNISCLVHTGPGRGGYLPGVDGGHAGDSPGIRWERFHRGHVGRWKGQEAAARLATGAGGETEKV